MQDKLITGVHNKARQRYEELLRATEEARTRAVEVLEDVGSLVLDDTVSDETLRQAIFATISSDDLNRLVVKITDILSIPRAVDRLLSDALWLFPA